jgi:hypothetical protein
LHHKNRIWVALEIHRWVYLLFVARKGRAEEGIVVVVVSESFFCFGGCFLCVCLELNLVSAGKFWRFWGLLS